jgi:hypothetical protein
MLIHCWRVASLDKETIAANWVQTEAVGGGGETKSKESSPVLRQSLSSSALSGSRGTLVRWQNCNGLRRSCGGAKK